MKYGKPAPLLVLPLLVLGCDKPRSTPGGTVTAGDVRRETREAAEAAGTLAAQKKAEYQKRMEEELEDLDRRIERLKARAADAGEEARARLEKELAELEPKREAARKKLEQFQAASAEAWEDMKEGVGNAFDELKQAYQRASERYK
jgi:hypothetical protein